MDMPRTMDNDDARAMVAHAGAQLAAEMTRSFNYDELVSIFLHDPMATLTFDDIRAMNACARLMLADFSDRDIAAIGNCAYMLSLVRYGDADDRIYNLCNAILATRRNER